jgi:hypothetical protein
MPKRLAQLAAAVFFASFVPSIASAGPITDLQDVLVGDGYILRFGHTLSVADLQVLAGRDDQGWHLGWFKKKLRDNDGPVDFTGLGPSFSGPSFQIISFGPSFQPLGGGLTSPILPIILGLPGSFPQNPAFTESPFSLGPSTAPPAVVTPEPTSLVLMGSGLLLVARRLRKMRSKEGPHGSASRPPQV